MNTLKKINYIDLAFAVLGIVLAVAIRYSLVDFKSFDFLKYSRVWYNTIRSEGFSAFGRNFSNYTPPYLYLLYLIARFFPDISEVIATKLPSMAADFITAGFAYRIVRLKYANSFLPLLAAFAVLFAPTVVINSAFWGQTDALYTCLLVATLYFLITRNLTLAMIMFGLSLSFKAQAIFMSPLLFALLLKREIPWKYYLLIPVVIFLTLVPSWMAGRSLLDLLSIYPAQTDTYKQLSMNAPSIFKLIPDSGDFYMYFYHAALASAAAVGIFYSLIVARSRAKMTPSILLELGLISVLMIPFILPKMHERYFYPADVISTLFAFYYPGYFFVPILMSAISFFSYEPTLFNVETIPFVLLALGVFFLIVFLCRDALIRLFSNEAGTGTPEGKEEGLDQQSQGT
jgi:Gpi18-like mannosyltransferase